MVPFARLVNVNISVNMSTLILLGILSLFQVIYGTMDFGFIEAGVEGKFPTKDWLSGKDMINREDSRRKQKLENTALTPTDFRANLSSCLQFFFDVQEVPHAFAGLSDALYNATTSGAPLVHNIITCTQNANIMDTFACLQNLESGIRDYYLSLHPLFIPAYNAFRDQLVKVKYELDSCLIKPKEHGTPSSIA